MALILSGNSMVTISTDCMFSFPTDGTGEEELEGSFHESLVERRKLRGTLFEVKERIHQGLQDL